MSTGMTTGFPTAVIFGVVARKLVLMVLDGDNVTASSLFVEKEGAVGCTA